MSSASSANDRGCFGAAWGLAGLAVLVAWPEAWIATLLLLGAGALILAVAWRSARARGDALEAGLTERDAVLVTVAKVRLIDGGPPGDDGEDVFVGVSDAGVWLAFVKTRRFDLFPAPQSADAGQPNTGRHGTVTIHGRGRSVSIYWPTPLQRMTDAGRRATAVAESIARHPQRDALRE